MTAQSGLGFSGIVAIQIPDDGAAGEVLTKLTADNYDYDWQVGGGGGGVVLTLSMPGNGVLRLTQDAGVSPIDVDQTTDFVYHPGLAGGQSVIGGTGAAEALTLQGSSNATRGTVQINGSTNIDFDWVTDIGLNAIVWDQVIPASGGAVTAMFLMSNTVTVNNSTFIPAAVREISNYEWTVAPGFAVSTLFLAQPRYFSTTPGISPAQSFIFAAQPQFESFGAGVTAPTTFRGLSANVILRARNAGDQVNLGNNHGMTFTGLWNTNNATAIVDFGNSAAVKLTNPTAVLFGQSLGTERCINWYGIDYDNITLTTTGERAVVHSSLVASGINFFLKNDGGAISDMGAGSVHLDDNANVNFGGTAVAPDVSTAWNSVLSSWQFAFALNTSQLQWSNPASNRFLFDNSGDSTDGEYNWNCLKFSLGAQTGAVGNQKGVFVAGAETVTIGGEFSQFLLTQAANDTLDAAISVYAGWTINAPSPTIGTGSLTTGVALNVGGNPSTASTNRVGVRIISNPSGGSGINAALWVTAGLSRFDGRVDINNGIALGGGAAATLGTIGGAGPTAAAQAQWMEVDIGGTAHWIPVWT